MINLLQQNDKRHTKYRDRIEIINSILEAANGSDVTQTRIMHKSLLSYAELKELLIVLIENEFIGFNELTDTFRTTEKGLGFLKVSNEVKNMRSKAEEEQQHLI